LFGDVGGGAFGCVLIDSTLTDNLAYIGGGGAAESTLTNCMLAHNWGSQEGGGAFGCILVNCVIKNNSAGNDGGGVAACVSDNCLIISNTASYSGGGANYYGLLNNCTIVGNSAPNGGGAFYVSLNNCIVYYNTPNNFDSCDLNYCCTTPLDPSNGNIINEPAFLNQFNGDFHLSSNSPCINAGNNAYTTNSTGLDGNPRIKGGTVDIGAYEYQTPTSVLSYAWAQQYGLSTDGTADYADSDIPIGDGMNNWHEWIAGTDPTDPSSVLKMLAPASTNNSSGLVVTWQSVNTRTYYLQRSTNLGAQPAFSTIQTNIA